MIRIYKTDEEYGQALQLYPYVFSVRNYAYFFTRQEWDDMPFTNTQPAFNPETQDLVVEEYEENDSVKRRWIVTEKESHE